MIEVIDRVPTHPGRVRLIPVQGQNDVYDLVRADEPVEEGTPINKALFESIRTDLSILSQNVANIINAHASLAEIGSLPAGAEFGLYENGILVPYIKISGDYHGTGRSAVLRKHIYKMDYLTNDIQRTRYANSNTDSWLNNEFLQLLESRVQEVIEPVSVPCTVGNDSLSPEIIDRKVFIVSLSECGVTNTNFYMHEGDPLPYFNSNERRRAQFNGKLEGWWTRTPNVAYNGYMAAFNATNGYDMVVPWQQQRGIRPSFTLPYNFEVSMGAPDTGNTMATAEVV